MNEFYILEIKETFMETHMSLALFSFYHSMIRSQSFPEPVSLGYDLHKCFSVLITFSSLDETGRLDRVELVIFYPSDQLGSDETQ